MPLADTPQRSRRWRRRCRRSCCPAVRAEFASYSREMEREADEGGQILCAAAGYDPMAMSTFLTSLAMSSRLERLHAESDFFDTHPGSEQRAAANAVRAREIRWSRDPALGDPRAALLKRIEGSRSVSGPRPACSRATASCTPCSVSRCVPIRLAEAEFQPRGRRDRTARRGGRLPLCDAPSGEVGRLRAIGSRSSRRRCTFGRGSRPVKVGGIDAWRVEANAVDAAPACAAAHLRSVPRRHLAHHGRGAGRGRQAARGRDAGHGAQLPPAHFPKSRATSKGHVCASKPPAPAKASPSCHVARATSGASTTRPSTTPYSQITVSRVVSWSRSRCANPIERRRAERRRAFNRRTFRARVCA